MRTELRDVIPASAIEAAAKAALRDQVGHTYPLEQLWEREGSAYEDGVRVVILAFLDEMGVTVEKAERGRFHCAQCQAIADHQPPAYRLGPSHWLRVEQAA